MSRNPSDSVGFTLVHGRRWTPALLSLVAAGVISSACTDSRPSQEAAPELPRNVGQALATGKRPEPPAQEIKGVGKDVPESARRARNSKEVLAELEGKDLLPGDKAVALRLTLAVQAGRQAGYKVNVDYPFSDGAAMAVSQEVKSWIQAKMAAFGFEEMEGKPDVTWIVHVQPGEGEAVYGLAASLWAEGTQLYQEAFVVPAQFASDRMDKVFGKGFVPKAP